MKIPKKDLESNAHLRNNTDHSFAWKFLSSTSVDRKIYKKSENVYALIIALKRQFLNEQVKSKNSDSHMMSFYVFLSIHVSLFIIMHRT